VFVSESFDEAQSPAVVAHTTSDRGFTAGLRTGRCLWSVTISADYYGRRHGANVFGFPGEPSRTDMIVRRRSTHLGETPRPHRERTGETGTRQSLPDEVVVSGA